MERKGEVYVWLHTIPTIVIVVLPLLESSFGSAISVGVFVEEEEEEVVVDFLVVDVAVGVVEMVVVMGSVLLGEGLMVTVPHRTGPQEVLTRSKKPPMYSPEYSTWNAFPAQRPAVPPATVALPTEGTVTLEGPTNWAMGISAILLPALQ